MTHPELKTVRWNLRKATKELLLLEEHLADPAQRCPDCIWKHLLKTEAWLEEAATLDNRKEYTALLRELGTTLGAVQLDVKRGDLRSASERSRLMRKKLQPWSV